MKKVLKDGEWVEGKASPELLEEDMRRLPEELLTKDAGDPDRIHKTDAPHIHDAIIGEFEERETGVTDEKELKKRLTISAQRKKLYPRMDRPIPISKINLAFERMAATVSLIKGAQALFDKYGGHMDEELNIELRELLGVHHLWFESDDVRGVSIRGGNPPADQDRPKYLKGHNLVVHPWEPDQHVKDLLSEMIGIDFDLLKKIFKPGLFDD